MIQEVCDAPECEPDGAACHAQGCVLGLCNPPLPDGTPCSDPCLAGGSCWNGACTGIAIDCDDGDPCTVDTCGAPGCLNNLVGYDGVFVAPEQGARNRVCPT